MGDFLVIGGAVIAGNFVADRWVIKSGPDDPTGFVEFSEGFGADDIARAAVIVGMILLAKKFLG